MKHTPRITIYLLCLFTLAQLIGVAVLYSYLDVSQTQATGTPVYQDAKIGGVVFERPAVEGASALLYIMSAVIIGTALVLLIFRYGQVWIWKSWFFIACTLCLTLALAAFIPSLIALALSVLLAGFRTFRPNLLTQNLSELLMYAGLSSLFVPIMNLTVGLGVLLFISLYDMYAVWHSKHMVTLAKAQTNSKLFAGLLLPYTKKGVVTKKQVLVEKKPRKLIKTAHSGGVQMAILGGGDIGFSLFFIGVVMGTYGLVQSLLIIPFVTAALALLFYKSEKGKFYPAMPFVSAGCLIGLQLVTMFW